MANPATILIADDQARYRSAVSKLLTGRGYRVLEAADGLQALATCRHERPDVLVLDLVMPHLDGMGVCRALRADEGMPYIPILFYSQRNSAADRVAALRAGGDDFVSKGAPAEELLARVEVLARIRRMLDAPQARSRTDIAAVKRPAQLPDATELAIQLNEQFEAAKVHSEPLSILLVDLDESAPPRFTGETTRALLGCSRGEGIVGLRSPHSWALLLPGAHFGGAMAVAEEVWRALAPSPIFPGVHIGAACYPNPTMHAPKDLVGVAEAALTRAHAAGAAQICLFHHQAYLFRPD